jgi:hypothetical protein
MILTYLGVGRGQIARGLFGNPRRVGIFMRVRETNQIRSVFARFNSQTIELVTNERGKPQSPAQRQMTAEGDTVFVACLRSGTPDDVGWLVVTFVLDNVLRPSIMRNWHGPPFSIGL